MPPRRTAADQKTREDSYRHRLLFYLHKLPVDVYQSTARVWVRWKMKRWVRVELRRLFSRLEKMGLVEPSNDPWFKIGRGVRIMFHLPSAMWKVLTEDIPRDDQD